MANFCFSTDLSKRVRQPEWMDEPNLDPQLHRQALAGLARVNRLSGSSRIVWPSILQLAKQRGGRPVRVLDIACGGGDVVLQLADHAARRRLPISFAGCDISDVALDVARQRAKSATNAEFFHFDALQQELPADYDVVMCSLFLHHLDEADAIRLLQRMGSAARTMVLVNDLRRCFTGYVAAYVGCRILTSSPIVHMDGPLSVSGAFRCDEALNLAESAGLHGATISKRWPWRFLLAWKKS